MANFLNIDGLSTLWAKIKATFYTKTQVDALIPEDEVMVVHVTYDETNDTLSADKTFSEITTHLNNNGIVYLIDYFSEYFQVTYYDSEGIAFTETAIHINGDANQQDVEMFFYTMNNSNNIEQNSYYGSWHSKAEISDVLTKTNTTSYTPTANYHPATKKYVDDATSNISIEQSDWNENDSINNDYILNKPAIKAGEGENSVMVGQTEPDEDAAIYTIYVSKGNVSSGTFTFTTEDTLPSAGNLKNYGVWYDSSQSSNQYSYIRDIDTSAGTITVNRTYGSGTVSDREIKIYYKYPISAAAYSYIEGRYSAADGAYAHAEGYQTKAFGSSSHAEGYLAKASGTYSHAENRNTEALGLASHAEGFNTIAVANYQHVQGKYNIEDTAGTYADIVGNGTSDSARSNAYTLDWLGNGWYAGKVSAGTVASPANPTAANDLATKAYVDANAGGLFVTLLSNDENAESGVSADKTPAEIVAAHREGKLCVARWVYEYGDYNDENFVLDGVYESESEGRVTAVFMRSTTEGVYMAYIETQNGTTTTDFSFSPLDALPLDYIDYHNNPPADGQVLMYNAIQGLWQNRTLNLTDELTELEDTDIYLPTNGQVLQYDSATSKWVNGNASGATYSLSISNNVITLTGSDGNTSSVTLPIYNGGVSS